MLDFSGEVLAQEMVHLQEQARAKAAGKLPERLTQGEIDRLIRNVRNNILNPGSKPSDGKNAPLYKYVVTLPGGEIEAEGRGERRWRLPADSQGQGLTELLTDPPSDEGAD